MLPKDVFVYYLRDENRKPFATVALKAHEGKWCRGVSVCRKTDFFNKKIGKLIAIGRLQNALINKISMPMKIVSSRNDSSNISKYLYMMSNKDNNICDANYLYSYGILKCSLTENEKRIIGE